MDKFKDIEGYETWASIEFVNKGWSKDKKYHIITKTGEHLLLRISDADSYEAKKKEFQMIKSVSNLGFDMSTPYGLGKCKEGVYMILKWIQGTCLEEVIETFTLEDQYRLGYEAGEILKKIHGVKIDIVPFSWADKFNKKIDIKIKQYEACPLKFKRGYLFIDHIEKTRHLLKNEPLVLHHGDYHIGNMVLNQVDKISVIDFNRFDYGGPWEEFNRIVWDCEKSPAFATGRVDGYFGSKVPKDFFRLLGLYIASNTLSSLPWAIPFGQKQIKVMTDQAEMILKDFDEFKSVVPAWYLKTKKILFIE